MVTFSSRLKHFLRILPLFACFAVNESYAKLCSFSLENVIGINVAGQLSSMKTWGARYQLNDWGSLESAQEMLRRDKIPPHTMLKPNGVSLQIVQSEKSNEMFELVSKDALILADELETSFDCESESKTRIWTGLADTTFFDFLLPHHLPSSTQDSLKLKTVWQILTSQAYESIFLLASLVVYLST
jgi:hypothetical protein